MLEFKQNITNKIINYGLRFLSIVSIIISIITFYAIQKSSCILIKIAPFILTFVLWSLYLLKDKLSIFLKLNILLLVLFFTGIYTLLLGLLDMASLWFVLTIIFAFFSKKRIFALYVFISAFILILTTGLLMISKNPHFPIDYGFENCQFACVTIRIINFLIIGFLIFKILKIFFETVELYIQEITEKNIVLEQLKAAEQKEADEKLKNQILKNDIEKHQLEIEYKRKELSSAFSKIFKFNNLLNLIKKDIVDKKYKDAITNLSIHQSHNYSIEDFLLKFNELYPDFQIKLQYKYPQLTDTEIKVSILITAGLKSSEIGNLLNVAETSIGKYRNRIRKKLNIESNTDISIHLLQTLKYSKNQ